MSKRIIIMAIIRIGGVHGVGKTTIIEAAKQYADKDVPLIKGSEIMAKILGISVEEIHEQSPEDRQAAREKMYTELLKITNGVRDGHYCVYTDTGYEFPFSSADKGRVAVAVALVASPNTVLERRKAIDRERPKDINKIKEQIELELFGAEQTAAKLDVPLEVIENEAHNQAAAKLGQLYREYLD